MHLTNCCFWAFLLFLLIMKWNKAFFRSKTSYFQSFYCSWWIKNYPDLIDFGPKKFSVPMLITEISKSCYESVTKLSEMSRRCYAGVTSYHGGYIELFSPIPDLKTKFKKIVIQWIYSWIECMTSFMIQAPQTMIRVEFQHGVSINR